MEKFEISEFEQTLQQNGPYIFVYNLYYQYLLHKPGEYDRLSQDHYVTRTQLMDELKEARKRYQEGGLLPMDVNPLIQRPLNDAPTVWLARFSKVVPANWEDFQVMHTDIIQAAHLNIQLSHELINACISHPSGEIAFDAGTSQELTTKQLFIVLCRADLTDEQKDQILLEQENLGAKPAVVTTAVQEARKVWDQINQRGAKPAGRKPTNSTA